MEIEGLTRENKVQKILYVRSGPYQVNPTSYNLQEVGLATAFAKKGFNVISCIITKLEILIKLSQRGVSK